MGRTNAIIWKVVTITVGLFFVALLQFVGYRFFWKNPDPAPSTTVTNVYAPVATVPKARVTPTPVPTGELELEAALIYNLGGVQPVARQNFYLLDRDLASILRKVSKKKDATDYDLVTNFGLLAKFGVIERELAEIKKHVKYETTTDFEGKAKFHNVKCMRYYVFGLVPTRRSSAVWNIPIVIENGTNTIILDQNNAAYSL